MMECIKTSEVDLRIKFPIKKDDGTLALIEAYKVQHSRYKQPCKGGDYNKITNLFIQ